MRLKKVNKVKINRSTKSHGPVNQSILKTVVRYFGKVIIIIFLIPHPLTANRHSGQSSKRG
jgi:hypothetical protein